MGDVARRLICEGIERAPDCTCAQSENVGVDHGRLNVRVAKELLDRANVGAGLEQVGRERVAQDRPAVRSHHLAIELRAPSMSVSEWQSRRGRCRSVSCSRGSIEIVEEGPDEVAAPVDAFLDRAGDGQDVLA